MDPHAISLTACKTQRGDAFGSCYISVYDALSTAVHVGGGCSGVSRSALALTSGNAENGSGSQMMTYVLTDYDHGNDWYYTFDTNQGNSVAITDGDNILNGRGDYSMTFNIVTPLESDVTLATLTYRYGGSGDTGAISNSTQHPSPYGGPVYVLLSLSVDNNFQFTINSTDLSGRQSPYGGTPWARYVGNPR
jgi:hypothetical protein